MEDLSLLFSMLVGYVAYSYNSYAIGAEGLVPSYSAYVPQLKISNSVSHTSASVPRRACTAGSCNSSVKTYAPGAEIAPLMSSAMKRGVGLFVVVTW